VLSLIPYIGNMIGVVLAVVLGALTSDDVGSALIGIAITFTIAQFVESYILEPYVVGQQVDLNPVLTILGVVAGSAVWGVAGMIIAIPVMGIIKVVCDQIDVLRPIGYLLGEEGIEESKGLTDRVKRWFS
jgi:predicted PurR-regulated permease PerM